MNTEMCRVCLSTDKQILPLDESFIINYNLLTNLNITLLDGLPQYSCKTCLDTVKFFIEFREKSITAETTLRDIYFAVKSEYKIQDVNEDKTSLESENEKVMCIKSEFKEESIDVTDNFDISYSDYDDDINNVIVKKYEEDVKPKRIKRKHKIKTVKTAKIIKNLANKLEQQWSCGICPKSFENKSDLNNHLDSHNSDRKCVLCNEQLNSLSQLLAHRLKHIPIKYSNCHMCDKKFRSCLHLEHHYRNMHIEGDDRNLSCTYCPVICDTPKKLKSHLRQVHSSIRYICDACSKGFQNKTNLKSHIRSHGMTKHYICDMCTFSCKHSGGLKDHKIRKHNPHRVYCKQCKRPFQSQMAHDKHVCSQTKCTICPICGLLITGNASLSRHMGIHSDIHKYECTRCPAKYKTKAALIAHVDRHDGNRTKQCEYCPAKFFTTTVLLKHRRTHTGEKPYVCRVCNKGFTGNYNLKVHMQVHGEYLIVKRNKDQEDLINVTK